MHLINAAPSCGSFVCSAVQEMNRSFEVVWGVLKFGRSFVFRRWCKAAAGLGDVRKSVSCNFEPSFRRRRVRGWLIWQLSGSSPCLSCMPMRFQRTLLSESLHLIDAAASVNPSHASWYDEVSRRNRLRRRGSPCTCNGTRSWEKHLAGGTSFWLRAVSPQR